MNIIITLNYVSRVMLIILGIIITMNPWEVEPGNEYLVQGFGVLAIAFGLFRLVTYYKRLQYLKSQEEVEEEDENVGEDEQTEGKQ